MHAIDTCLEILVAWGGTTLAFVKVAVTALSLLIVTLHVPVPLQAPPHPTNVEPLFRAAVSATDVPDV